VPRMSASNGCNTSCVAGYRKPVMNRGPDATALDWRFARAMVASY
jgi:hypothetical protein